MADKDKQEATQAAVDQIKEKYGEGSIMKFGEASPGDVNAISTGCLSLDLALGIQGVPRGRVVEIYGPEASGKTTLAQHIIAETQKEDGIAAFIDAEHALDPEYAKKIGVDVDELLISQPDTGEEALEILETLVRSNGLDVVVLDSVAALVPKEEIEGEMGDSHVALQARLMSQALRKLTGFIGKTNTTVIFLNQIRMKVGTYFGNPETTPGGRALKFYSSVRIELRRRAKIKHQGDIIGNRVKAKVAKNKVAAPFKTTEFDIMYNQGISTAGDTMKVGMEHGIIEKRGHTYYYEGDKLDDLEKLEVGKEKTKKFLNQDPEIMEEIREEILEKIEEEKQEEEAEEQENEEEEKEENDEEKTEEEEKED
ncbi:MAG: recombinase RecA [Parcubacteria group bacterium QH_9_35_7]|nr:MAG: recombinase RecA [Parcubacteria group bacterium QH_9_35_7]